MPSCFVSFLTSFHIISLKHLNQKNSEDVKPSIHSWDFPWLDDITKILVFEFFILKSLKCSRYIVVNTMDGCLWGLKRVDYGGCTMESTYLCIKKAESLEGRHPPKATKMFQIFSGITWRIEIDMCLEL